jgi:hypothetical protein
MLYNLLVSFFQNKFRASRVHDGWDNANRPHKGAGRDGLVASGVPRYMSGEFP